MPQNQSGNPLENQAEIQSAILMPLVGDIFLIDALYPHGDQWQVSLTFRYDRSRSLVVLKDRLKMAGYDYTLSETPDGPLLLTLDPRRKLRVPLLNVVLFLATIVSVYFVSLTFRFWWPIGSWPQMKAAILRGDGILFTVAMISILLVHEMGHFVASRRRHIATSWPYFIPAPNILGTFGAVIKSRSPFWNRRDLMEVGAAGPIFGWIVAIGWLVYGLSHSVIAPTTAVHIGDLSWTLRGESILFRLLTIWTAGDAPVGSVYILSEAAFAGWAGLLVTAINLLPIGQLDGGHITYSLIRRKQVMLGWIAVACLVALGFQSMMWWLFAAMGLIFKVEHPPTLNDEKPLTRTALVMGIIALIILLLSFTPIPIQT